MGANGSDVAPPFIHVNALTCALPEDITMAMRVCSTPGCPTLVSAGARGGRCVTHAREADRARGTKAERGYDASYLRERAQWVARQASGEVLTCWRCGTTIVGAFHLGHDDDDRSVVRGPEHASCNLIAAGRKRS